MSATPSPLVTATLVSQGGAVKVELAAAVPNPSSGDILSMQVKLSGGSADRLTLRLYTKALMVVTEQTVNGPYHPGWNATAFSWPAGIGKGLYYFTVMASNPTSVSTSEICKVFYLGP